jgi:pyruvate formate lyase activating enzyme
MEAAALKFENKTWKKLDDGKVQCMTCSHRCTIAPGKSGICGIRKNVDGKLLLLSYGRAIACHIDPIEKKPLHHVLPGTRIYSIGLLYVS